MATDPKPPARIVDPEAGKAKLLREGRCRACGRPISAVRLTRHHLVSRSLGGDDVDDNLVPACGDGTTGCHGILETHPSGWQTTAIQLRSRLRPEEVAYITAKKNTAFLDRYYRRTIEGASPMAETVSTKTLLIDVDSISVNPWNPNVVPDEIMDALVENIRLHGILQSVTVREVDTPGEGGETVPGSGKYELVDGEHRWRAAKLAGHDQVWGTITTMSRDDARAQTLALNRLRGEMDPTGVAQILADLKSNGVELEQLATYTGYGLDEMEAMVKLLDYKWPDAPPEPEAGGDDGEWRTLSMRMPVEVYDIVMSELDRLGGVTGSEYEFRALELMAVTSAQTPLESFQ